MKQFLKRIARCVLPLRVRCWWLGRPYGERAHYEVASMLGGESPNPWIRKSAEIKGWLFPGDHEFLWELATRRLTGDILEIGTWMGKSACILAGACAETAPATKVVCVDTFLMTGTPDQEKYHRRLAPMASGTFYDFLENANRLGFIDYVVPIAATSTRALPLLHGPFRMAFVDGGHDRENCQRDVELCLRLLAPGGVLAIHDVGGGVWIELEEYVCEVLMRSSSLKHIATRGVIAAFEVLGPTNQV